MPTPGTSYQLECEGICIRVTHKRVKNVNFRVGADGQARMSVPLCTTREQAECLARKRIGWFRDHLARFESMEAVEPKERTEEERRMLEEELRTRLEHLLPECERRVGVKASSVTLRRMKTRWGSCTVKTGRIRINTALAECPERCLEMVLVHELCHLRVPNHGPRFQALMDLHCPDWRASRRWLDEHPPRV